MRIIITFLGFFLFIVIPFYFNWNFVPSMIFMLIITFFFILVYFVLQYYPKSNKINENYYNKKILPEIRSFLELNSVVIQNKRILFPLPDRDFDPTETALSWKILKDHYKFQIEFATENGSKKPVCDMITLKGQGLSSISKLIFDMLDIRVKQNVVLKAYESLEKDANFCNPKSWKLLDFADYDGIWITGGHAPGMKQFLDNKDLQRKISEFWDYEKPIAAVCHGVLLVARSTLKDEPLKSVLFGRKTTSLVNYQEIFAYVLTAWSHGKLFRTYEETTEDEIIRLIYGTKTVEEAKKINKVMELYDEGPLKVKKEFEGKNIGEFGYIVEDGNYLSGRWPGDVEILAHRFAQNLQKKK